MAQDEEASATAVRFSISSAKRKQQQVRVIHNQDEHQGEENEVQFVRSIDQINQGAASNLSRGAPQKIIPRQENSWQPEKRMRNLLPAPDDIAQEFISEVVPAGPVNGVQYGLSIRSGAGTDSRSLKMDVARAREIRSQLDKQALDDHLFTLPEPAPIHAYESMPVDKFGEALLAGMGWKSGGGVGKRATEDVKAFEFVKRPERLGLGAVPAPKEVKEKKWIKPGETREPKPDLVAPVGPDGKVRHRVEIGEKLVERVKKGVYGGKTMSIISGKHAGLHGEVLGRKDKPAGSDDVVQVKLARSGETVQVYGGDLAEVGSLEEEKAVKKLKELKIAREEKQRPWLTSQIRVRIVSKKFQGGKLYLKKGRVIDVVAPTVCNLVMDEGGELVEGVRQEYLETALPKKGGRVLIVEGEHRGSVARLLERNSEDANAVVQMEESLEMVCLVLDHLAEYTGDGAG